MYKKQLIKFYSKLSRDIGGDIGNDKDGNKDGNKDINKVNTLTDTMEYELRFGQKSAGKFAPIFNENIKQKVFDALDIELDSLISEESINSYYDDNIRKVSIKSKDSNGNEILKDTIECKEVIKRLDWFMDTGLCLRFAVSNEKAVPNEDRVLSKLAQSQPSVVRKKVRQIYKVKKSTTELHFTTIETVNKDGAKVTHEMEIEYKKIKDIDLRLLDKILNCFN